VRACLQGCTHPVHWSERGRERKREGESEKEREKDVELSRIVIFIFKRNDGCLGTFSYLVLYRVHDEKRIG
jgi:hypothetical protein